jgi:type I restriction enzyme S subunit
MPQQTEWNWHRLSDLTLPTRTWNPRSEPREFIRYVDVSAISRDELRVLGAPSIPSDNAPSRARKIVHDGDTVFATVRPTLTRIAQIPTSLNGEIVSTAFCVLRPAPGSK